MADGISVTGTGVAAPRRDAEAMGTVEVAPVAQAAVQVAVVVSVAPLTSHGAPAETGVMTAGELAAANTGEETATAAPVREGMTLAEDALLTNSRSDPYRGSLC